MRTFRRIRSLATLGLYTGTERAPDADILFASIQALSLLVSAILHNPALGFNFEPW